MSKIGEVDNKRYYADWKKYYIQNWKFIVTDNSRSYTALLCETNTTTDVQQRRKDWKGDNTTISYSYQNFGEQLWRII